MSNEYRKKAASGGRVESGSVDDKVRAASQGKLKAETPSFKLPTGAATRQVPLPKPPYSGPPVQPKATSVAPHSTKQIKHEYKRATGEDY